MARNIVEGFERGAAAAQGAVKGNTAEEEIAAENPYGCNQHGHGWVDPCPYGGDGSNGMAGKSALQLAGGAENVNPEPDEDEEEEKKKAEAEAKAKAEEEARKKAEAEQKAKEEAERKAEAEKKEIFAAIDEKDKKWGELAEGFRKQLEAMKGLEGTKEYKKAAEALRNIEWYKSSFAHWKGLAEKGNEEERSRALQYLAVLKETNSDAEVYEKYAKAGKRAFKALEKVGKEQQEAPKVSKGVVDKEVATNKMVIKAESRMHQVGTDMEKAVRIMSARGVNIAQEEMHKAASELVAAIRKVKGDEQYFADNNDPAKVLPAGLMKKIAANPSQLKASKQKQFAKFISQFEPIMEINEDALGEILKERGGRFVNCFEKPGVCSGSNPDYIDAREAAENKLFGTEKGMISTKRPVYAYLRRNIEETIRRSHGYGDMCVTFKPVVRNRCTMTGGDSLNHYDDDLTSCALLSAPEKGNCLRGWQIEEINDGVSFDSMESKSLYMEAQIFGDLTANDIKSIGIPTYKRDALETANYYANMLKKYNKSVKVTKKYNHYLVEVE